MKKIVLSFLITPIIFFANTLPVFAQQYHDDDSVKLTPAQQKAQIKLEEHSNNLNVSWNNLTQTPQFIRAKDLAIPWVSNNKAQQAYQFLELFAPLYKIKFSLKIFFIYKLFPHDSV